MYFPSDQLNNAFQKLEISKPLNNKKDEYLKNVRSQKRKVHLQNKRLSAAISLSSQLENLHIQENDTLGQGLSIQEFIAECHGKTFILTAEQISELVASIYSPSLYRQHYGVIGIRKLLAIENPPIQPLIDADVLPQLVEFLGREDEYQLQLEAAWALSNLSSGTTEQTQQVVENGAIPALIKLLKSSNKDGRAQAIWTLGNIAGDNIGFRDQIIQEGIMGPLVKTMDEALNGGDQPMINHGTWTLSNLCRGKPFPNFNDIKDALPVFVRVVMGQENVDVLIDALWALSYLSDGGEERIQKVLDTGVVPYIVKHMEMSWGSALIPCLRILGNLFSGNNSQVNSLLAVPGVLENLFIALKNPRKTIKREAAWTLSNISAGSSEHIGHIVGNSEYLDLLISVGLNDEFEVRREIVWIFSNALNNANLEQLKILFEKKIVGFFGKTIEDVGDVKTLETGLQGIWKILFGYKVWRIEGLSLLEKNELIGKIEKLQYHPNLQIYELATKILKYFENEEEDGIVSD